MSSNKSELEKIVESKYGPYGNLISKPKHTIICEKIEEGLSYDIQDIFDKILEEEKYDELLTKIYTEYDIKITNDILKKLLKDFCYSDDEKNKIISIIDESSNAFNQTGGRRRRMRKTHKKRATRRSHKAKKHTRKTRKH